MLKLTDLRKTFNVGTVNERPALCGVNLHVKDGEFVTVIGGNGSGKSTMLNIISGLYYCDGGKIMLDNENITNKTEYQRAKYLGRVFQDPMMGTAATMTIEENLSMAYRRTKKRGLNWGLTKKEKSVYKEVVKTLDLGLENRMTTKMGLLSGGQRQAVTLLMATLQKPKLLLLDEHTAALDPKTAAKVLQITNEIVQEHKLTALMVTHNMKDAIRTGSRLIMMNNGNIIYDVSGEEKKNLTVKDLLQKFEEASQGDFVADDRMLLG